MTLHHHQVTSRPMPDMDSHVASKRKGRKIPREWARMDARRSTDGGTCYCDICKLLFTVKYIRQVHLNMHDGTINACHDCIHDFKLTPL